MKTRTMLSAVAAVALPLGGLAAEKPRVFITESGVVQVSGEASVADTKGALSLTGGTSPENVEVMKAFMKRCPDVIVTSNRDKADYVVRFDHEAVNPTTLFVRGNKVAVFNRDENLVYSGSTRLLSNAVKGACAAITGNRRNNTP